MVGGGGFQLGDGFIPLFLERFHRRRVGGRQLLQLGCVVPLLVGELRPLPLDSAVQFGLHQRQLVALFSKRANYGGPLLKLAFDVDKPFLEGLHLGQDGGNACEQTRKLKIEIHPGKCRTDKISGRHTFQFGEPGVLRLLGAPQVSNLLLEDAVGCQQSVKDDLAMLAHVLQEDKS